MGGFFVIGLWGEAAAERASLADGAMGARLTAAREPLAARTGSEQVNHSI